MAQNTNMYVWDGTNFVPWGGTVTTAAGSGGTVSIAGTVPISGTLAMLQAGTITVIQGGTVETKPYTTVVSGELAVGTAAGGTATGSVACKLVRFKARTNNPGTIFVGGGTTVTVADGTTDTTTGMGMIAGDDTGWIPAANVNEFFFISSGTTNAVTYLAVT